MRIRVGIDLDDTLCDFTTPLNEYYNAKYSTAYHVEDYTRPHAEVWNISSFEADKVIESFIFGPVEENLPAHGDLSCSLKPLPEAQEFFKTINRDIYEFYLISARNNALYESTQKWLTEHFPNVFSGIELCDYHSDRPKRCKTDVCKQLGIRIMIDDTPDNIKCSSIETLAFARPWTMQNDVFTWPELTHYFIPLALAARITKRLPEHVLIAFSGKYGSGKDTAAGIVRKYFPMFECLAFATRLKETTAAFVRMPLELFYTQEGKGIKPPGFEDTLGRMLQKNGQIMKTVYGPDVWVRLTMTEAASKAYPLITDCRLLIEAKAIEAVTSSLLIRVNGDPVRLRALNADGRDLNHISETELDDYNFRNVVKNDGTLEELERKLIAIIFPYLYFLC